jgi:hypothetical protein
MLAVERVHRLGRRRLGGHGHESKSAVTGEELSVHYVSKLREFGFSDVECAEHEVGRRKLTIIEGRRA